MQAHERLLQYIQFDTASDESSASCPSTPGQLVLGAALAKEMHSIGIQNARLDEHGYVYGSIPANAENQPTIGLIAHMDTVDDAPVLPMNARIVAYDGKDLALNAEGEILSTERYPYLKKYAGQHLIVTDGRTILGADDKAGVAEIMTACERLIQDPSIPHGKIAIAFTPDEEIGRGADKFDVPSFGADFAYTVDGGELGGIECENFNAASANLTIHGVNIHPGSAKDKMKSAILIGSEFMSLLPAAEAPAHTEGYEGFFHIVSMTGEVERAELKYIIRDHDQDKFAAKKALFQTCANFINKKHGAGTCQPRITDSYLNMKICFEGKEFIIDRAKAALQEAGITPYLEPIRGGTDGARLSYMGLPTPNLPTGGMNYHGRHECISVESMEKMVDVLVNLVRAR